MSIETEQLILELRNRSSAKRRAAAKKLRRIHDRDATEPLLAALATEIEDPRTWETQYQMIMALAECGTEATAAPLLDRVLASALEPMVWLAAGDALVRLSANIDSAVATAISSTSASRIEGAARALAMKHERPSGETISALLQLARSHSGIRFWVAAAAAGWPDEPNVRAFLTTCLDDQSAETQRAARASLEGKFLKWNPL